MTRLSAVPIDQERPPYPFAALLGVPRLQTALLLLAVDPSLGGVLVRGPRGTAKSTAAQALAQLIPDAPFVSVPLSASVEQVVGTLELADALRDGQVRWRPGLIARAHGGVLYVDEVNLLPDVLADALLEAAASGVHVVERDGISHRHPARFALVGSMNPEEGELRPQLLDRFALCVDVENPVEVELRCAIAKARLAYEADPQAFVAQYAVPQQELRQRIHRARQRLASLVWPEEVLQLACQRCARAGVDGVRADVALLKAARAHAALHGKEVPDRLDVDAVSDMVLTHRSGGWTGDRQAPNAGDGSGLSWTGGVSPVGADPPSVDAAAAASAMPAHGAVVVGQAPKAPSEQGSAASLGAAAAAEARQRIPPASSQDADSADSPNPWGMLAPTRTDVRPWRPEAWAWPKKPAGPRR